jgi:uncharacterized repeat protein (TIGR03943 family)
MISTRYRIYQGLALTGMGLFILMTGSQGELGEFVSSRLNILLLLTSALMIGLAQIVFQIRKKDVGEGRLIPLEDQKARLWWFILPVVVGFLLTVHHPEPQYLDVNGLLLRQSSVGSESPGFALLETLPNRRTIRDWLMVFDDAPDREVLTGQPVAVTGVVHHVRRIRGDIFLLYRFVTGAGLGDSYAAGILVLWPDMDALEEGDWVSVTGTLDQVHLNWLPEPVPLIIGVEVQAVEPLLQAVEHLDKGD